MTTAQNNSDQITVTLPDGSTRAIAAGSTGMDVANGIAKSLAKKALVARVNGELWDLDRPLEGDAELAIITRDDDDALEIIRHDCAHVMAQAVQELFPGTQVTIGPVIENGFFYDFHREESFAPEDFEAIEKRMAEIIKQDKPFTRHVYDRKDAIKFFKDKGEEFKVELIEDLPEDQTITLYDQGDWIDLCRGPHAPSTGKVGNHFKLMKMT